jgi:hypothetical protein
MAASSSSSERDKTSRLPKVVRGVDLNPEQAAADRWVRQAYDERLATTRDLARQWGATVTALTGLFGLGALAGADTAVRALDGGWRVAYGACALVAVGAAALSITLAALASQATFTSVGPTAEDRLDAFEDRVRGARIGLRRSRVAALVALLAAVASIAVRWYAPV